MSTLVASTAHNAVHVGVVSSEVWIWFSIQDAGRGQTGASMQLRPEQARMLAATLLGAAEQIENKREEATQPS